VDRDQITSIIVLDDQPAERDSLARLLGEAGYSRVRQASSADEALELAHAEPPDLIIADILMPAVDGYQFARMLRADPVVGHTPVVFWTASYLQEPVRDLAAACGVFHFLPKPVDLEVVVRVVESAVVAPPQAPQPAPLDRDFDTEHLRLLNDKLVQKVHEADVANQEERRHLEQLNISQTLLQTSERDLRTSESRLDVSEDRLQTIIDNSEAGIFVKALDDFRYVIANSAMEDAYGVGPGEMVGKRDDEILSADIVERVRARDRKVAETGQPTRDEEVLPSSNGERTFISLRFPVRRLDGELDAVAGISTEITEHKRDEEQLQILTSELQQSNADLEQFAYVAAHDLSEPLRAITGMVQLLERRYKGRLDEGADEYISSAIDATGRLQALIDDLLAYARVGRAQLSNDPVDSSALVRQIVEGLQDKIEGSQAVVSVDSLPTLHADATQLQQVFQNLIVNSMKFKNSIDPRIRISAEREGVAWRFSVTDNGIGIDPPHSKRVFEVFKRLHGRTEYSGSGIGLSICKRIVERHGGEIWVEPVSGGGSRFQFTIPDGREGRR
jgi:PAS domain S-box-containing protein